MIPGMKVVFEDRDILVVEKSAGEVVHPAPGYETGTMSDRLRAVSHWRLLQKKGGVSLLQFDIETGRMHQVRIHAAELGCPIVGDSLYGSRERDSHLRRRPTRTLLHAVRLAFLHPATGRPVEFLAEPPADIVYAV